MTSTPIARRATPADLPEIRRVVNLAYQVEAFFVEGDRISPAELQARFARDGAEFLVIDAPEAGLLSAAVHFEDRGDHGWFGLLAVDPASQGAGHARTLLKAMESRCRALGLPRLQLEMVDLRRELPAFYAKFGFVEVARKAFPDAEKLKMPAEMIVMGKTVNGER
ncbi:MAG: GNAT family N-acetyltransferase [Gemmatimonadales bacterium]